MFTDWLENYHLTQISLQRIQGLAKLIRWSFI